MRLSNTQKMYEADMAAIHVAGIPSVMLMQNAAGNLARAALDVMGLNHSAVVFCGSGNNGGDGVAAARYLLQCGVSVRAFLVGRREKMTHDCREMETRLEEEGGVLEDLDLQDADLPDLLAKAGVIVDAIFGLGLKRAVTGTALQAIRLINASGTPVVAADIPSGVAADTGAVLGEAVRCVRTVTFSMAKPGHFLEPGCVYCGRVETCSIGIPGEILENAFCGVEAVTRRDVSLPSRDPLTHKGDYGKILIVGGSTGYSGAPALCARAGSPGGSGTGIPGGAPGDLGSVRLQMRGSHAVPLACDGQGRLTAEALDVLKPRLAECGVLVLGPGLGRSAETVKLTAALLAAAGGPVVLDADGLWAAAQDPEMLRQASGPVIVTPHAGEFTRLGGDLTGDRLCDAGVFARKYGCITLLKGHRTVIAWPDGRACIIAAGNPGMARGGSGDVLSGVLGAMLGQFSVDKAVVAGAWIHAAAGDACAAERGEYGMTPSDMIEKLPYIMKGIQGKK